jgi:uncharacterized membrane-anchored protein
VRYLSLKSEKYMCCTWESCPGVRLRTLLVVAGLFLSGAVLFCETCVADLPSLPLVPQEPIAWVPGPVTAALGSVADLQVPKGYSYADANGARAFLQAMHKPVPKGVAGILQPDSGAWWITFEFAETGYVNDEDRNRLDPAAILKRFSPQTEGPRLYPGSAAGPTANTAGWALKPVYDKDVHSLEWAVLIPGHGETAATLNHTLRLFSRSGFLDAVVTQPRRDSSELIPLKQLASGISFKRTQTYADHKAGDKLAPFGVASCIAATTAAINSEAWAGSDAFGGISAFWIGSFVVICLGAVAIVLLVKKMRQYRSHRPAVETARPAVKPIIAVPVASVAAAIPHTNGSKTSHIHPKPKLPARNGNHHHSKNHSKNRKKVFNYAKFYTEMVLQGPAPVMGVEPTNGYDVELSRLANMSASNEIQRQDSATALNMNSQMITSQKAIIEEQQRLIEEQARLIEEKSRLISEKNQLLKRQSELIDNNLV